MDHPCTRLVARYGPEQGLYLYGEWCMLVMLGPDAFRNRHTPDQLRALGDLLAPLALWPAEGLDGQGPPAGAVEEEPQDPLLLVASSLWRPGLRLHCGADLFAAIGAWAAAGGVAPGAWFDASRAALTETLGFVPPPLPVALQADLPTHGYQLSIWGEAVLEGVSYPGLDMVLGPADGPPPPLPYPWTPDPTGPGWVAWMPIGPESQPPADLGRIHWLVAIDRHLTACLPRFADRLVSTTIVRALLAEAERADYDHELERYVSLPELRLVFQALLRQGLPLRPIAPMLEAMLRAILGELASRPLTPPELEKLGRQLPVFSTARLVGVVRGSLGLPAEPRPPGPARGLRALDAPAPPLRPVPAHTPADAEAWAALATLAQATRADAARLTGLVRRARPHVGEPRPLPALPPFTDVAQPAAEPRRAAPDPDAPPRAAATGPLEPPAPDDDELLRWEQAVRAWVEADEAIARANLALAGGGAWPAGVPEPAHPDWAWTLRRPGTLIMSPGG